MEPSREILLTQARPQAKLPQHMLQCVLFSGKDALIHRPIETQLILHPNFGYDASSSTLT